MIRPGFLDIELRQNLIELARNGSAAHRLARRANALVLLDDGLSGEQQEKLKAWVATALPRTTRQVGAWIENEFGVVYEGRD